ncbi:hypothetical protein RF11_02267 [Thelohanellus kitauei]|uniref:Uncharacterized protein n=1 Tax=Thelohanellus kitauei TaxID=669202 RepID=A0A0C2J301_THEKT|nr:hypothetical protein RF11_02267 [Thelohanellus kitauei]
MFEESDHPKLMTDYHYGLMCRDEQDCDCNHCKLVLVDQKCEKSHCFNNGLQIDLIQVAKRENCEECKGKGQNCIIQKAAQNMKNDMSSVIAMRKVQLADYASFNARLLVKMDIVHMIHI